MIAHSRPVTDDHRPAEQALIAELSRIMARCEHPLAPLLELTVAALGASRRAAGVFQLAQTGGWTAAAVTGAAPRRWRAVEQALRGFGTSLGAVSRHGRSTRTVPDAASWTAAAARPLPDGHGVAVVLEAAGSRVGLLVLPDCAVADWAAIPVSVRTGLAMCLAGGLIRHTARDRAVFTERSERAIRRLFEEGAQARDVAEAGAVVARVAAEAFRTERAGVYVVDDDGMICFAVGVGVATELSDALQASLLGRAAADSPVWQALERHAGPSLVDDAGAADVRPGGFVQTLGFRSYAAIPLLSGNGPLGMVICGDASGRRTWTPRERELAARFALEGALIIDAARLRASEREQLERATHRAFHDGLTGVPNRSLLTVRTEAALATAAVSMTSVAMLLLDLDDFKQVNDTLGHAYGDALLRVVAERLTHSLRPGDTLARLGGDEFAILLPDDAGTEQALAVASRIEALLSDPIDLEGIALNAVASIGIAVFPEHANGATDLIQRADIAMYASKTSGARVTVYHPSHDGATIDRLTLYTELRHAIAGGQLHLVYQPKLELATGEVTGVEALVRWHHPRRGLVPPGDFLPLAESTDLIHPLTEWVLENALAQRSEWAAAGITVDLAVNVSVRNLLDATVMGRLARLIRRFGASRDLLLEITETAVMSDPLQAADALTAVRALGVRISMDDFGAGYSSLAQLKRLPFDELKIDRMLVRDCATSEVDAALVETIVGLGRRLGLSVVAEGIETAAALRTVQTMGCDHGQGFFIDRPLPAAEVPAAVTRHARPAPAGGASARHCSTEPTVPLLPTC